MKKLTTKIIFDKVYHWAKDNGLKGWWGCYGTMVLRFKDKSEEDGLTVGYLQFDASLGYCTLSIVSEYTKLEREETIFLADPFGRTSRPDDIFLFDLNGDYIKKVTQGELDKFQES